MEARVSFIAEEDAFERTGSVDRDARRSVEHVVQDGLGRRGQQVWLQKCGGLTSTLPTSGRLGATSSTASPVVKDPTPSS